MSLSLRPVLATAAVICMAFVVKFSAPVITHDLTPSQFPWISSLVTSWLNPPYIYLIINAIVLTIVASTKLQRYFNFNPDDCSDPAISLADKLAIAYGAGNVLDTKLLEVTPMLEIRQECIGANDDFEVDDKAWEIKRAVIVNDVQVDEVDLKVNSSGNHVTENTKYLEDTEESVISTLPWNAMNEISKPPASARFHHQRATKANREEGKMLKVSKHRRLDTLENSWKAITDGRPMPLTSQLRKSDTWAIHQDSGIKELQGHNRMTTSKTFNEQHSHNSNNNELMTAVARSSDSENLRRDPSLSQEELNKRAEAFIHKFKEDMRLQRKESLNRYMEMINSGAD